jgi:peptidoglycan/xylan/chitin deacetylase (PgdA/CDA1 family)
MYHGVVERIQDARLDRWNIAKEEFARHVDFLSRSYQIVSLADVVEAVEHGHPLPDAVALVFDDAFANVYRNARPLLRERRLPYCVAVPSGLLGSKRTEWALEVQLIVLRGALPRIRLRENGGATDWPLITRRQRAVAAKALLNHLLAAPHNARRRQIEAVRDQLSASSWDGLMDEFCELKLMNADQLRELHNEGVTIAAHGSLHVPLAECEPLEILHQEIAGAKDTLEELLCSSVDYFVYPYGISSRAAIEQVRDSGYRAAFTTRHGLLRRNEDLFQLPRIAAECPLSHLCQKLDTLPS